MVERPTVERMWPRVDGLRTLELGLPGEQRDRLNAYVLHGSKRATAGTLAEYTEEGEALEHVGERLVLLDSDAAAVGRVQVTAVDVMPFDEVPWEFADAEGEGFASIEDWREAHRAHWARGGRTVTPGTPVVCIRFDLLSES
jgi:uncharacterized protein YhfF